MFKPAWFRGGAGGVYSAAVTLDLALPAPGVSDTEALGRRLAALLRRGDVVYLEGPLGAGKTVLARGLIQALAGEAIEVPSPTFSLVQSYDLDPPVTHADLYRLEDAAEVAELGLDEAAEAGILLVEWPDRGEGFLPGEALEVSAEDGDDGRIWRLKGNTAWARRLAEMETE